MLNPARLIPRLALPALLLLLSGCYGLRPSAGGGQTTFTGPREIRPADVALPEGYRIEAVATGLTFPTAVAFDEQGRAHVLEAGYSYGEEWTVPRLLRVEPEGALTEVARGENPPWNGLDHHRGAFYVAEGGHARGGRILRVGQDGRITPLIENLPSLGDHHTNGPAVGPGGWIYFGQGTATNSGVVGEDNYAFGWLPRHPEFHDIPCRDLRLRGRNFTTGNPLTPDAEDRATTGAFSPFGTATTEGETVRGRLPCNGAVMRIPLDGGEPELVAWGFRNPFGLAFSPEGRLYVTDNSFDERGSRPVWGTGDLLWAVTPGTWYGWPDFHGGDPLTDANQYRPLGEPPLEFLLAEHPNAAPRAAAVLGVHSSSNGFDFSRSAAFGHLGEAFIAQFGDMAPGVGKVLAPVGFKVVRVEVNTGVVRDFAVNRGSTNGPASRVGGGGLERPVAARFDPAGTALYVVDFGVMAVGPRGPEPRQETGVLWRITREEGGR
ncbi:MAG: PQQ-dependent sugar dehydrogenase [Longimicrobiaceae bacterium]